MNPKGGIRFPVRVVKKFFSRVVNKGNSTTSTQLLFYQRNRIWVMRIGRITENRTATDCQISNTVARVCNCHSRRSNGYLTLCCCAIQGMELCPWELAPRRRGGISFCICDMSAPFFITELIPFFQMHHVSVVFGGTKCILQMNDGRDNFNRGANSHRHNSLIRAILRDCANSRHS